MKAQMKDKWKEILVHPQSSIRETIEKIDNGSMKIALVIDDQEKLLGTVSDGDIRRAILKGLSLDNPVEQIMNKKPVTATLGESKENILSIMKVKQIQHVPIIDEKGTLIDLEVFGNLIKPPLKDNLVVLMAGGLGTRLYPLTQDKPKSMLEIGNKPILETILLNFIECGFWRFRISVNFKADMVMSYFGDGSKWGVEIEYLHESERMGTAGSLSLLKEKPTETLLVMNADLLTKVNFNYLINFHEKQTSMATMCVREYDFQVPYGVVNLKGQKIENIQEKPLYKFFANAGIYALDPSVMQFIQNDTFLDMTELFEKLIAQNIETCAFPVREYWLDIGQHSDFERAKSEYIEVFQ